MPIPSDAPLFVLIATVQLFMFALLLWLAEPYWDESALLMAGLLYLLNVTLWIGCIRLMRGDYDRA